MCACACACEASVSHGADRRGKHQQVCVGCQKVSCVLLHLFYDVRSHTLFYCVHSHTLHTCASTSLTRSISCSRVCIGCQKVSWVILHEFVCTFSHPTHLRLDVVDVFYFGLQCVHRVLECHMFYCIDAYGVATVSRIDKIIRLFCRIASLL